MTELNPRFLEIKKTLLLGAQTIINRKMKSAESSIETYGHVYNPIDLFVTMNTDLAFFENTIAQTILLSPKLLDQIDVFKEPLKKHALVEVKERVLAIYESNAQTEERLEEFLEHLNKIGIYLLPFKNNYNNVIQKRAKERFFYNEGTALSQDDLNFIETTVLDEVRKIIAQKCSTNNAVNYIDILASINTSILDLESSFSDIFIFGQSLLDKIEEEKSEITSKAKQEIEEKVFNIVINSLSAGSRNYRITLYLKLLKDKGIYTNNSTYIEICTGKQLKK